MATRKADVAPNQTVNLTSALSLDLDAAYLIELGAGSSTFDSIALAYDADPETVGGHVLTHGRPRFITQGADPWFGRFDSLLAAPTEIVATEATVCSAD